MDKRQGLPAGTVLRFPALPCVVETEMGRGSNAIVYKGWYKDSLNAGQKHHVLIKELFAYHPKGAIARDENSLQILCGEDAREVEQTHLKSFIWGNEAHLRLREKAPADIGGNINTYFYNNTYYTLLDFSGGRTLLREMQSQEGQAVSLRRTAQRMMGLLDSLDVFHGMGLLHLDVSPDNILLIHSGKKERVELIDFNSVVPMDTIKQTQRLRLSMKPGYASPEIRAQRISAIGPWTDLYSVAAVFFYCLMRRPLSDMEYGGVQAVNVSHSALLKDAPETVKSLVRRILSRGLAAVAQRRYPSAAEMRTDFQELIDRIDGVGVTHWALWETGRLEIQKIVRMNPALSYLSDETQSYPIEMDAPAQSGLKAFLRGECNAVLAGGGGTGKTTLLMQMALRQSRSYRGDRPAMVYISLYDYQQDSASFLHDHLLRRMRFKPETDGYDGARHSLDLLLQKPLASSSGEAPVLCLLLDGYNEISGNPEPLRQEILQLANMEGVAVLLSSRNELPSLGFETWTIKPLSLETIEGVLKSKGLLMPAAEQMRELLKTALMLSLYVRACLNGKEQFVIKTKAELIGAYLNALKNKELQALPEDSPVKWQMEAALECVYPIIADMENRKGASVSDEELLPAIRALYSLLGKKALTKRFPRWIGHASDIRGDAEDGEAWYGLMVHNLLWNRLGLLYRDIEGSYRMAHQEFRDVLSPFGANMRALLYQKRRWKIVGAVALCLAALTGAALLWPKAAPAYDAQSAIDALDSVQSLYTGCNAQFVAMLTLMDDQAPKAAFEQARKNLWRNSGLTFMDLNGDGRASDEWMSKMQNFLQEGTRFPWNDRTFELTYFREMAEWFDERQETYGDYIDVLEAVYQGASWEAYDQCRQAILDVLQADARVAAAYSQLLYTMNQTGLAQWENSKEGQAFKGAYQRMENGRRYTQETDAFGSDAWDNLSLEEMISALTDAQSERLARQKALSSVTPFALFHQAVP